MKWMNVSEFVAFGYLQEVNRQFLHPLGLALAVATLEDGTVKLAGIVDYRDDPEGMVFEGLGPAEIIKAQRVAALQELASKKRAAALGYYVQPLPGSEE